MFTKEELEKLYLEKYKPHAAFLMDEPALWNLCCDTALSEDAMSGIKFANDYLGVPPVKSFLAYRRPELEKMFGEDGEIKLSDAAKRAIGAFWGTVFKGILGYQEQKSVSVRVPGTSVRTATVFWDQQEGSDS